MKNWDYIAKMESDSSNECTTINDLPNELLISIFENMKIKDLIRCSLVCKRFKQICGHVKILELIIKTKIENKKDFWFYTNKQFNHQDAINVTTFCTYRSTMRLDKLKRLHFKGSTAEFDLLNVNDLTDLEQMKVDLRHSCDDCTVYIDLPNLRIIEVEKSGLDIMYITAPKLEKIKCCSFLDIFLTDPSTVNYLETGIHTDSIEVLTNLQFYQFPSNYLSNIDPANLLSVFPKLTVLSLDECYHGFGVYELYSLVEQKLDFQRHDLKIYFEAVELDSTRKIDEYCAHFSSLEHQIDNYNSLRVVRGIIINYTELMYLVGGEIPDDFHKKYSNVRSIKVKDKVEDQTHLYRFLEAFNYLAKLNLNGDSLDQSFYSDLGQLEQLTDLTIENCPQLISDYDFLFKLKLLKSFSTDSDSTNFFDLTLALFSRLKYFRTIIFFSKERILVMRFKRETKSVFHVSCSCNKHFNLMLNFADLPRAFEEYTDLINLDSSHA